MARGKRILITSISGAGPMDAMRKLGEYGAFRYRRTPKLLRLDKFFCHEAISRKLIPEIARDRSRQFQTIVALQNPKTLLRECYRSAFQRLADEEEFQNSDSDIFLYAHCCFYHQKTREYFTLLDEELLLNTFAPELVITLVDDIENIHERLKQSDEMLDESGYQYTGLHGIINTCQNLSTLIHWRASEFALAERLALRCGAEHFLVAVKHPLETVAALIYDSTRPRVYLSHPITTPRRMLAAGDESFFGHSPMACSGYAGSYGPEPSCGSPQPSTNSGCAESL